MDVGGFAILTTIGVGVAASAMFSFVCAAAVNYVLTSQIVFKRSLNANSFVKFFGAAIIGLAVNVGVTVSLVSHLAGPVVLAKVIGVGVAFFVNFALNVSVVFKR